MRREKYIGKWFFAQHKGSFHFPKNSEGLLKNSTATPHALCVGLEIF
ncbi:hypothetical protein SAMN05421877_105152 [Sphingobacterium lactis]|uniref:Uncharacterized protein n=1 Tax=Sphingobacterium lactis TaxID=797291 RepID=A0A1H5XXB0_9SPHI|nr:hypothetical protein SAMN05421877_105152 [Sphingobacterium lactis]